MRFGKGPKLKEGARRIRTGFLLFPKCIQGQWRWLEYASWEEIYKKYKYRAPECPDTVAYFWRAIKWL